MEKCAGRACPAPTGWREIDRALLIKSYSLTQSLHKRYMFPLDVTGWMVYTVGRRAVLSYYILCQFFHSIPDFHERSVSYASLPEELPCVLPGVPQVLPAFPRDAGAAAPRPDPQEGVLTPRRRVLPRGAAPVSRRRRVSGAAALLTGGPALRYTIYIV